MRCSFLASSCSPPSRDNCECSGNSIGWMDRQSLLASNVHALNEQFASWVGEQREKSRDELWIDGAEDYVKHAKKILEDFKDVLEANKNQQKSAVAALSEAPTTSGFAARGSELFSFGADLAKPSNEASKPAFGGLNFGVQTGNGAALQGGLFGFPHSSGTFGSLANGNGAAAQEDEMEETEQILQPEVQIDQNAEILFQAVATLFLQAPAEEKAWSNKGRGTFTLRKPVQGDGPRRPCHLVFTTEAGRVLVNAPLYTGLKPKENEGDLTTEQRLVCVKVDEEKLPDLVAKIQANLPG